MDSNSKGEREEEIVKEMVEASRNGIGCLAAAMTIICCSCNRSDLSGSSNGNISDIRVAENKHALLKCPPGTTLKGHPSIEKPNKLFCVLADGTRHGPWVSLEAHRKVMAEGESYEGKSHGRIVSWENKERGIKQLEAFFSRN